MLGFERKPNAVRSEGLGLGGPKPATGTFPLSGAGVPQPPVAPAPAAPPDLGLSQDERAGFAFRDLAAARRGQPLPSEQLVAQRKADLQQRQQQFVQGIALLRMLDEGIQRLPDDQREEKREAVRAEVEQLSPSASKLFDVFVRKDDRLGKYLSEVAATDETVKALQAMGRSPQEISDYLANRLTSPEGLAEAKQKQAVAEFPEVATKLERLFTTTDPELRARVAELSKDGFTRGELLSLNDALPEGEEGSKLTPDQLEALPLLEGELAQRFPDRFQTSAEFEQGRSLEQKAKAAASGEKEPKAATADQTKAAGFAKRLQQSELDFEDIFKSYDPTTVSAGIESSLPNVAKSSDRQRYEQAQRNFVNAVLRRESGAAISPAEFENANQQYFPQAGDSPEVAEQKRRNRLQAFESLKAASGSAFETTPLVSASPQARPSQEAIRAELERRRAAKAKGS